MIMEQSFGNRPGLDMVLDLLLAETILGRLV
jgi:hypothetical protein